MNLRKNSIKMVELCGGLGVFSATKVKKIVAPRDRLL